MSKTVAILMAPGFEDAETIVTIDILRRLKLEVEVLACQSEREVLSYFKLPVRADALLGERATTLYDAIVLPGGPQGARNLGTSAEVVAFVKAHDAADRIVAAICSAGAHVLSQNNLLHGRRYTCSGENYKLYSDGQYVDQDIVEDGNILSGRGLGLVFEFAFTLGAKLAGAAMAEDAAEHIYVPFPRKG
jgi:DJ-1 family protein